MLQNGLVLDWVRLNGLGSVGILSYGGIKDLVTFNTAAAGNTNNPSNDISEILNLGMCGNLKGNKYYMHCTTPTFRTK